MTLVNLSKREKTLAAATISVLVVVLAYNFMINPLFKRLDSLNEEIKSDEMKLKSNLKIMSKKGNIQNQYLKYSEFLKQKNPDEQEMGLFLAGIESVARKIAIRITDMKPREIRQVDFYKRLTVDIELEASLGEITEFIYNLQNSSDLFSIDRFRLEKKSRRSLALKGYLRVSRDIIP